MNQIEPEGLGYIKLLVPQQRIQEPNLPLQWCIAPDLIRELEDRKIAHPFLLICVTDKDGNEVRGSRKLVKLDQQHVRLPFNRPGEHSIHARVVWDLDAGQLGLQRQYLKRWNGSRQAPYGYDVFDDESLLEGIRVKRAKEEGTTDEEIVENAPDDADIQIEEVEEEAEEDDDNVIEVENMEAFKALVAERRRERTISTRYVSGIGLTKLTVVINDNLFAKPVREWVRWWLTFPNGGSPDLVDQCDLRRRVIIGFTLKPFGIALQVLGITAARAVVALFWGVLLLSEGVHWKALVHPYSMFVDDLVPNWPRVRKIMRGKLGEYNKRTGAWDLKWTLPLWIAVTPLSWVVSLLAGLGFALSQELPVTFYNVLTSAGLVLAGVCGLMTVIVLLLMVLVGIFEAVERSKTAVGRWFRARARRRREAVMKEAEELAEKGEFERRFEDLVCDTGGAVYRPVAELKKRSPMVIYGEIKAALCRPFPTP